MDGSRFSIKCLLTLMDVVRLSIRLDTSTTDSKLYKIKFLSLLFIEH